MLKSRIYQFSRKTLVIILTIVTISFACEESNEIISCDNFRIRLSELEYADCGGSNGNLAIEALGGKEPYLYRLDNNEPQTSNQFTDLDPQYYSIIVEDANGCKDSVRTFIGGVQAVKAIALITHSGCGSDNGSLEIIAKNGIEPYRYQLGENANYTFENTFTDLPSGVHSIWVKDERDCFLGLYPIILNGVTTENISPFIINNCATSGCHDSSIEPNLSMLDELEKIPRKILETARSENHYNPQLPTPQLDSLICWIEDLELKNN